MKLPLFIETKPRVLQSSVVVLQGGKWRIEAKNLIDSVVNLSLGDSLIPITNNKEFEISASRYVQASIVRPGNESQLTIYVVKI